MKKKVIVSLLVGAGIASMPVVAEATEIKAINSDNTATIEVVEAEEVDESFEVISEGNVLGNEIPGNSGEVVEDVVGPNGSNVVEDGSDEDNMEVTPEIEGLPGVPDIERPEGSHNRPEAPIGSDSNVENGSEDDNMDVVSETALNELNYAIEEMRIAINTLNSEGMTVENRETILTFGGTAIERIRSFYDEIQGSDEVNGHLVWINESWAQISEAEKNFHIAGDGSSEDDMGVTPEIEGIPGVPEIAGPEGSHNKPEGPIESDSNVGDGSHEDNMEVTPEIEGIPGIPDVEGPAGSNIVEDGSAEDNIGIVSEAALNALNYAIEEMRIAINLLNSEGMSVENRETILTFGATAIERIRGFYNEIQGSDEVNGHLVWLNESWAQISEAENNFHIAGDGSHEDDMGVTPEVEGLPGVPDIAGPEGSHDRPILSPDIIEDGSGEDDFQINDFQINPDLEFPSTGDGSGEDDFQINPDLEFPSIGDGSGEDDFQINPDLEFPSIGDGSGEDDMEVTPDKIPATGVGSGMTLYASALLGLAGLRKKLKK
jgi:hypothetical protein